MKNYKIVIIDQKKTMKKLKGLLEHEGFVVSTSSPFNVKPASKAFNGELVRFDILLSEESMASTFQKIHAFSGAPFFILSARVDDTDQLIRMEKGIRDNIDRLIYPTAVRNYLKAESDPKRQFSRDGKLQAGPISMDPKNFRVSVSGTEIHLTPIEFNLLKLLVSNPGKVFTRHELMAVLYGPGVEDRYRSVDCHIAHIRGKLSKHLRGRKLIRSVYGTGYTFRPPSGA